MDRLQTDGHCNSKTEWAQWVGSMKITKILICICFSSFSFNSQELFLKLNLKSQKTKNSNQIFHLQKKIEEQ